MPDVKSKARLYLTDGLAAGAPVSLADESAHYLTAVMRVAAGDAVRVFNGRDGEWLARVTQAGRRGCSVAVESRLRPQRPEPGPWLLFAPIKRTPLDFLVEKATELGAERLWPVITEWTGAARVNVRRLQAHAREAAEQCERLTVPDVLEPTALTRLPERWPADRPLLVPDTEGGGRPLAEILDAMQLPAGGSPPAHGLLIGPEGGLTPSELDALRVLPFVTLVGLGPRILRAETAALAAMACWQALVGGGKVPP